MKILVQQNESVKIAFAENVSVPPTVSSLQMSATSYNPFVSKSPSREDCLHTYLPRLW